MHNIDTTETRAHHNIDTALYHLIFSTVEKRLPTLQPDIDFTAEQICGKHFWRKLGDGERRTAGIIISSISTLKQLSLIDAGKNSSNAKIYQILQE